MARCPHCKQPVSLGQPSQGTPVRKVIIGLIKKEVMYSCPHCDKVLGFGFFLGGMITGRP